MRSLVIGGDGFIGSRLVSELSGYGEVLWTSRKHHLVHSVHLDLIDVPDTLPNADVVFLCAATTRFIECEDNPEAYRVNVDAQLKIAAMRPWKVVYLSSEAVERALHTNYGMQKALCEIGLLNVCQPRIVRLSKVVPDTVSYACHYIASLANEKPGIYHWTGKSHQIKAAA